MKAMSLLLLLAVLLGAFIGGLASGLVVGRYLRRTERSGSAEPAPPDEWTAAEIDRAAATWATANRRSPEAASVMADKLHLLHHLGQRRGWWGR